MEGASPCQHSPTRAHAQGTRSRPLGPDTPGSAPRSSIGAVRDIDPRQLRVRLAAAFQDFLRPELQARRAVGIGRLPDIDDEASV